ncbi:MAG: aminoglycoside phosphotransferase family protein [Blastochloris sp.]|nr:aminoglycoside phosphotransferase family protein [Blastochloris sp.]
MPHDPSLDPYAILRTLRVQRIHAVAPISGGSDTALWRVEHDGVISALRVFRSNQAQVCLREMQALELAAAHSIPVPQARAHGYWHDCPAVLLSWLPGEPLATRLQRQPWRMVRFGRAFGQMQARIHHIIAQPFADEAPTDWITWYQAVDSELAAQLRRLATQSPRLLHLDYHPLNVMVDHVGVSGVLDWANVQTGDPRADVARTYTILVVEPHHAAREPLWYRVARRILAKTWLVGYQSIAGDLRDMPPFFAWAGLVMQADLAPRVDNPNSWWRPQHLAAVQRWTQQWRERV